MSQFFTSLIKQSARSVKTKYNYLKNEYKMYEQEMEQVKKRQEKEKENYNNYKSNSNTYTNTNSNNGNKNSKQSNKYTPDYIKKNPFFWSNVIKTKLRQFLMLFSREYYKSRPKLLEQDSNSNKSANLPTVKDIKGGITKIGVGVKNSVVLVLDTVNSLIVKVSYGYIDIHKIVKTGLAPIVKHLPSISSIPFHKLNYQNLMILYRNMGNYVGKLNQNAGNYLKKYRDPKAYEEFKNYYDNYIKQLEEEAKKRGENRANSTNGFFARYMPRTYSKFKFMTNDNIKKINKYIKAPSYKQKYYNYELRFKQFFQQNELGKYVKVSYFKETFSGLGTKAKNIRPSNVKDFLAGGIKRKMYRLLFMFGSVVFAYYFLKYVFYSVTKGRSDRNLKDALDAIKDLKSQNEELMRYNRDLMSKIERGGKY